MSFNADDTICAVASAPSGAGRGIVRVSGQAAVDIAAQLFEAADRQLNDAVTRASALPGRVSIRVGGAFRYLPCDLLIWPTSRSYTREPVAELHTIGSPPLLEALVAAVCKAGARLAEPGEFTLRAFLAGRLDLTQAEAVLGVIDARGSGDLDTALIQLAGGLARPLDRLRDELLQLLAELEAGLDFVDEDIEFISSSELHERIESAERLLNEVEHQMDSRHVARETLQIALVGPPNVGKSSLFNALVERFGCEHPTGRAQHAPALVSSQQGTTRDYLIATISLNGTQCELIDTAGIDETFGGQSGSNSQRAQSRCSAIDLTAQSLASERREQATIRAICIEARSAVDESQLLDLKGWFAISDCDIVVLTKADALSNSELRFESLNGTPILLTSSRSGQGLEELCGELGRLILNDESAQCGRVVASTAGRCRESVRLAATSISRASELVQAGGGNELVAVELRSALEEIGRVVGAVYTNDLLDRIFGTFCIGK
jgi:tRNA modification GTPase